MGRELVRNCPSSSGPLPPVGILGDKGEICFKKENAELSIAVFVFKEFSEYISPIFSWKYSF